jgi:hypothetical protein
VWPDLVGVLLHERVIDGSHVFLSFSRHNI